MAVIERVMLDYLARKAADELIERFPDAEGFIRRACGKASPDSAIRGRWWFRKS